MSQIALFYAQNFQISNRDLVARLLNEKYLDMLISSATGLLQSKKPTDGRERLASILLYATETLGQISTIDGNARSFDKVSLGSIAAHYMGRPFIASDALAQSHAVQQAYALGDLVDSIREHYRQILFLALSPHTPRGISLTKAFGEEAEINIASVKKQMLRAGKQVFSRNATTMGILKPNNDADMSAILRTTQDQLGGLPIPKQIPTPNQLQKALMG